MGDANSSLPDFSNPPVVEVALSLQFDAISRLRIPQIGALWNEFRAGFPVTKERAPLDPAFERFGHTHTSGRAGVHFQMLDAPPIPRCWFLNEAGTELIQVQPDRFIHNWRKVKGQEDYPRYERLRETFAAELARFQAFLEREELGALTPSQCEISYVNHVVPPEGQGHARLDRIMSLVSLRYNEEFLKEPEDARVALRYVIRHDDQPIGRLHVAADPSHQHSDGRPIYVLTLTARGEPLAPTIAGSLQFMDLGREWVVRAFADVTTKEMHKLWGRKT